MAAHAKANNSQTKEMPKKQEPLAPVKTVQPQKNNIGNDNRKELQRQQRLFQQLEEKLAKMNREKQELENALALPQIYQDVVKFKQTETAYQQITQQIAEANTQYEIIFEKILSLESE
jgi:ATP-binding cassette subfamily F protein 3